MSSIVVQDPDVESFYSTTGGNFFGPSGASGRLMVNTTPRRQRKATVADIVNRLRPKLSNIPGLARFALGAAGDPRWRTHVQERLRFHALRTGHAATLQRSPETGAHHRQDCRACRKCTSDLQIKTPRVNIVLDRDRAAALHLNWSTISSTLYDAFGPQFASTIYAPTNQYRVLLEMLPQIPAAYRRARHDLSQERQRQHDPVEAPWRSWWPNAGPQSIPHSGQLPSVTISFALKPGHLARGGHDGD